MPQIPARLPFPASLHQRPVVFGSWPLCLPNTLVHSRKTLRTRVRDGVEVGVWLEFVRFSVRVGVWTYTLVHVQYLDWQKNRHRVQMEPREHQHSLLHRLGG